MTENKGTEVLDAKRKAVRWLPLACPECRGIFRIKKSTIGHGVSCPLCEQRLLTAEGPVVEFDAAAAFAQAKIELAEAQSDFENASQEHGHSERKKHHAGQQNTLDWEEREEPDENNSISPMGVLTVVLIFLSLVGVGLYMWKTNVAQSEKDAIERALLVDAMALPKPLKDEVSGRDEEDVLAVEKEAGKLNKMASMEAVEQMTERIKLFLEAKTVEEKSNFVRDRERVFPFMEEFYGRSSYEPEGYRKIGDVRDLAAGNSIIATVVRVKDFTDYPIAAEYIDGEWFIDWESWVGYSEMSIEKLREKKPSTEVSVRVMISVESYYNYDFNDDDEWVSFRLRFKDSFEDLWGYVKRGSVEEAAIVNQFQKKKEKAMQLKIKYPADPRNGDQVLISEVLSEGWVQLSDDEKKDQ